MGMSGNRLAEVMSKIGNESAQMTRSEIISGTVTSTSPLSISFMAEESKQITIPAGMLVVPYTCREKSIVVQGETVRLWGNLAVGERVILLSANNGQRYLVNRA